MANIHNRNLEERFRFTMSVQTDGKMSFSSVGLHTLPELIGYLRAVCCNLENRMLTPGELITDLTGMRQNLK